MAMRADIAAPQRARGRPKGTGIDDRDRVVRLQEMLSADRSLKPTTAIRQLGVTDPSVIRRLRDKLATVALPVPAAAKPATKALLKAAAIKSEPAKPSPALTDKLPEEKKAPLPVVSAAVTPTPQQAAPPPTPPPAPAINPAEQKAREAALLAAYLQAMQQSQPLPIAPSAEAKPEPKAAPRPEPPKPEPPKPQAPAFPFAHMMPPMGFPGMPSFPGMPQMPGMPGMPNPMQAFSIPGMPSFLQPFQQKQQAPQPGTEQARQLEALKLAIEATTAIARFQLHLVENAAAYSPMAMMLQGQSFIGQMMIAGLTGQLGALHRQMTKPAPGPVSGEKK